MQAHSPHLDPASMVLKLREDLVFAPQCHGSDLYYYLESVKEGNYFRIGYAEYVFVSLLDGKTPFSEALALTARALGANALSQTQAKEVCGWLVEHKLVQFEALQDSTPAPHRQKPWYQQLNPLWIKVPFGSPDTWITSLADGCRFLLRPWLFAITVCLITLSIVLVLYQYDVFIESISQVILPNNWLRLALIWIALKFIHELGHAIACKLFGGEIRDCGLVFVLFAPLAYVDVTSAWRFSQRWQRVAVAAAGIYVELVAASLAAIAWIYTDSPTLEPWLVNIFVSATVTTILFNINPLMRFDGYFILADALMIPNLYGRAQQHAKGFWSRLFWGERRIEAKLKGVSRTLLTAYGILCMLWRTIMTISMVLAASLMFAGGGFYLSVLAIFLWLAKPLSRFVTDLYRRFMETPHSLIRGGLIGSVALALAFVMFAVVPWPGEIVAPGIVQFSDEGIVRAQVNGFIKTIHVSDGEHVERGQVLIELSNPQLHYQLAEIEERIGAEASALRLALDEKRNSDVQISKRNLEAFTLRRDEIEHDLDSLKIIATTSGRVIARELPRTIDRYVRRGDELITIENPAQKEIKAVLTTEQARALAKTEDADVRFYAGPEQTFLGYLHQVQPRATTQVPHEALSAKAGGALAVKPISESKSEQGEELVTPHVLATILLYPEFGAQAFTGQRGNVHLGSHHRTLVERWWHPLLNWVNRYRLQG